MVPAYSGALSYGLGMYYYPEDIYNLPLMGEVSAATGLGVTSALSTFAGTFVGNMILPYIPKVGMVSNQLKYVANPVGSGAAAYLMAKSGGNDTAGVNIALIGGASAVGGQYLYDVLNKPASA